MFSHHIILYPSCNRAQPRNLFANVRFAGPSTQAAVSVGKVCRPARVTPLKTCVPYVVADINLQIS